MNVMIEGMEHPRTYEALRDFLVGQEFRVHQWELREPAPGQTGVPLLYGAFDECSTLSPGHLSGPRPEKWIALCASKRAPAVGFRPRHCVRDIEGALARASASADVDILFPEQWQPDTPKAMMSAEGIGYLAVLRCGGLVLTLWEWTPEVVGVSPATHERFRIVYTVGDPDSVGAALADVLECDFVADAGTLSSAAGVVAAIEAIGDAPEVYCLLDTGPNITLEERAEKTVDAGGMVLHRVLNTLQEPYLLVRTFDRRPLGFFAGS